MGISVPEDISIIGFDDIESSKDVSGINYYAYYKEAMGERAVKKLIDRINGEKLMEEKYYCLPFLLKDSRLSNYKSNSVFI